MDVRVEPAAGADKPVIRRLLELNAHDFSEIDGREIGPHGEYGYPYLDHYWSPEENRHPFVIRVDGRIAGCALVRAGTPHRFGEFFIVRKHRRSGVGTVAARTVLSRFPGTWLVEEVAGNDAAVRFWRQAIPFDFDEVTDATGTSQRFTIPG